MWKWIVAAGLFLIAGLLFFLLYRRSKLALDYWQHAANALSMDEIALLIGELEEAGEVIIAKLEAKQQAMREELGLMEERITALQQTMEKPVDINEHSAGPLSSDTLRPSFQNEKIGLVLQRHRMGFDPVAIAQESRLNPDEVRLIISLYGKSLD